MGTLQVLHSLAHPGIRATQRLVTQCYVWFGINADIRQWAHSCLQCQRAKVHRHANSSTGTFTTPDTRFDLVHIVLVGPLPPSDGLCVDMCGPVHTVAVGSPHRRHHCRDGGESIHPHLGHPFWHTFHHHH